MAVLFTIMTDRSRIFIGRFLFGLDNDWITYTCILLFFGGVILSYCSLVSSILLRVKRFLCDIEVIANPSFIHTKIHNSSQ